MKKVTLKSHHLFKCQYVLAVFIITFSIQIASAQQNTRFSYATEAKKENANYFEILKTKKEELKSYDLSNINDLKEYKHFNRWAEYWRLRVNADGSFPDENLAYYNAGILDAEGKIIQNENRARVSTETWTNIGAQEVPNANGYSNFPQMGRLSAFLRIKHPTDTAQDVLFVGAPNGGIWKSTDGGTTWSPKLDMVAGIGVTDIKTTPDATFANYTTKPIYVSTGDYDGGHVRSIGVLKSTDGGETYASTGLTFNLIQQAVLGDLIVIDATTVFVGTTTGVSKTTDGGTTWTEAFSSGFSGVNLGRAARNGTEIMYTGVFAGIYYTSDYTNDSNWSAVVSAMEDNNKAAVTVDDNGDFYIQVENGQIKKFNKTTSEKFNKMISAFTDVGSIPPGYNSQQGYNQALIVRNDMMISGEFNGTHSTDNGASWYRSLNGYWSDPANPQGGTTSDGNYIHSDHHRLGKLDGTYQFWSVNDGGLNYINYTSNTDQKPTIAYKSAKTIVTQHFSVAINPSVSGSDDYVVGNQDNDAFSKVDGIWYAVALGDGIESAINYTTPSIRYATNQSGFISRSDAGFKNERNGDYSLVPAGISFNHYMELDRTNPTILYINSDNRSDSDGNTIPISDNGIYKVVDNSTALVATNMDSGTPIHKFNTHGSLILGLADNNIIRKIPTDGSAASSITGAQSIGDVVIESIDFNASNTNVIYVSTQGYNAGKKVYKSTDGGANFTNITNNLPNVIINKILYKQGASSEILFVATNVGVYVTANGGTSWSKLGQGLPNVDVKDIEINYTANKLVAATFGRGLWSVNVADSTLGINQTVVEELLGFNVHPNPLKNGNLKISLKDSLNVNYEIYNVVGGIVKKGKLNFDKESNVESLSNNIYLIRVYNSNFSITKKVVLAK